MRERLYIRTYDTIPAELAAEMRAWREFLVGEGYTVRLRDHESGGEVSVRMSDTPDDFPTVIVEGDCRSLLFEKVLGRVIYALSANSDSLMVRRGVIAGQGDAENRR